GFGEFTLLVQPGFGIGRARVSRVAPLLTAEVDLGVASRRPVRSVALFPDNAFMRRPRLDQRPINAEMLIRDQSLPFGNGQHPVEELTRQRVRQQSYTVDTEPRAVPNRIIDAEPHEPAELEVIVELLHPLPLAADRIEHL